MNLHSFLSDGVTPAGYPKNALVAANDGCLYGVTQYWEDGFAGIIFKITTDGLFTIVTKLSTNIGTPRSALITSDDGSFYGFASGKRHVVYKMAANGDVTIVGTATTTTDSATGALLKASDGDLYLTVDDNYDRQHGIYKLTLPVQMNMAHTPTNIVISWPTNKAGFQLEYAATPDAATWTEVTDAPVVSGSSFVTSDGLASATRFYRLRK